MESDVECRHYCRSLPRGPAAHLDAVLLALLRWGSGGILCACLAGGVPVSTTATAKRYELVPLALASDPNDRRGHQICRGRLLRTTCIDLLYMTHHPQ